MTDDEVLDSLKSELQSKILKIPKKVIDGDVMTVRAWKKDVEGSKKLLVKDRLTKEQVISAIGLMDVWLQA